MATIRRVVSMGTFVVLFILPFVTAQGFGNDRHDTFNRQGKVPYNANAKRFDGADEIKRQETDLDRAQMQRGAQPQGAQRYNNPYQNQQLPPRNDLNPPQNTFNRINPAMANSENRDPHNLGQGRAPVPVQRGLPKKSPPVKISDHPACAADVKSLCSASSLTNNFAVLDCLQNDVKVITDRSVLF